MPDSYEMKIHVEIQRPEPQEYTIFVNSEDGPLMVRSYDFPALEPEDFDALIEIVRRSNKEIAAPCIKYDGCPCGREHLGPPEDSRP